MKSDFSVYLIVTVQIRTFVDEGNDVETVEDFMNALKEKPIAHTSVFLAAVKRPSHSEKSEIKNISSIHDIHISKKELIARRYNGIGNGITISRKKLVPNQSKLEIEDHSKLCASEVKPCVFLSRKIISETFHA